jgi:hypothetical protein
MPRPVRTALVVAGLCVCTAFVGAASAAIFDSVSSQLVRSQSATWSWLVSGPENNAYFGRPRGTSDLNVGTNGLGGGSDWQGSAITFTGEDGNFEFEHSSSVRKTILGEHALRLGAADGQDVVPLIVAAGSTTRRYVQLWSVGHRTVAAIGVDGGLRIGDITLVAGIDAAGRVEVDAVRKNGDRFPLLVGVPS